MVSEGSLLNFLEFYRIKSTTHLLFSRWLAEIRMEPIFLSRICMHTDYREGRLKAHFLHSLVLFLSKHSISVRQWGPEYVMQ